MTTRKKHYVEFYSPGMLMAEVSRREIAEWDPRLAVGIAGTITERHGATPFGFRFVTVLTADPVSDGMGGTLDVHERELSRSGTYYLPDSRVVTYEQETGHIARENMKGNGYPLGVETIRGYRSAHYFEEGDFIVDTAGNVVTRGDDTQHVLYRARKKTEWQKSQSWTRLSALEQETLAEAERRP